ncbi:MAG: glycosyltransferase [Pseudomonadota bacterium]
MSDRGQPVQIIYQTRFSYLGQSGWQSAASTDPALLFDDARLARRFALFERLTLPSLAAQTDPDFLHVVLTARTMPKLWRKRLVELCSDTLGPERVRVMAKGPASASLRFRVFVRRHFDPRQPLAQVVLDDDDALSCDFTELLKIEAHHAVTHDLPRSGYTFLSFATGLSLHLHDHAPPSLAWRNVPFTNLGLSLVAPADTDRHPLATSHKRIGERHPSRVIAARRPFYIRTVHGDNDSRAFADTTPLSRKRLFAAHQAFPFLADAMQSPMVAPLLAAQ